MSGKHKLRDLFLIGRDNLKTILAPSKRYIMSRQGEIIEVDKAGVSAESDATFEEQVNNVNSLVISGERGDLRQIETIIRNMTSIYSNAVLREDLFHTNEANPTTEQTWQEGTVLSLSDQRQINYLTVDIPDHTSTTATELVINLEGSEDNATWLPIATATYTVADVKTATTITEIIEGVATFRYLRWSAESVTDIPATVSVGHSPVAFDRFLTADEGDRINELVGESYDLSVFIEGGMPSIDEVVAFRAPQRLTLKANFEDCVAKCMSPPRNAFGLEVYKNASQIGTITLNSNGAVTASYVETVFNEGDTFSLKANTIADPQLSDVALTLVFTRG